MSIRNRMIKQRTLTNAMAARRSHISDETLRPRDTAAFAELDEMERMGWGSTPQTEIPSDWRTHHGPDHVGTNKTKQEHGGKR